MSTSFYISNISEIINKNKRLYRRVNFLANFLSTESLSALFRPDSPDFDIILLISIVMAKSSAAAPMKWLLRENKHTEAMMKDRWRPAATDLDSLKALSEDTLGFHYASQLIDNSICMLKYDDLAAE